MVIVVVYSRLALMLDFKPEVQITRETIIVDNTRSMDCQSYFARIKNNPVIWIIA